MAAMNSAVLASSYVISGLSDGHLKSFSVSSVKLPMVKAQQARVVCELKEESQKGIEGSKRVALIGLAAVFLASTTSMSSANAGVFDSYLENSKVNKELNDKKRLATSGANFARAYTVQFGTCKFPENFTGCQDLAKTKKVPFLSEDLILECQGKDKYKCGSNVFWKWD